MMIIIGGRGLHTPPACVQVNAMLQALQVEDEAAQEQTGQAELDSLPDEIEPQVGTIGASYSDSHVWHQPQQN